MIFRPVRKDKDIHPEHPTTKATIYCNTPLDSPTHFLNLPREIRQDIFFYYLLSLNLPTQRFHPLTLLGWWTPGENQSINTLNTETGYHYDNYNLGRCISLPLTNLFLANRKFHQEAEDVLYHSFIFSIKARHLASPEALQLYFNHGKGCAGKLKSKLRHIQLNCNLNGKSWRFGSSRAWYTHGGPVASYCEDWIRILTYLAHELPNLRSVALAVDYVGDEKSASTSTSSSREEDEEEKEMISLVTSFAQIFGPQHHINRNKNNTVTIERKVILRLVQLVPYFDGSYEATLTPFSHPVYSSLLESEKLLLRLRDKEGLKWYQIARHFDDPESEMYSVDGLQARYERIKKWKRPAELEARCLAILKRENEGVYV